jgi:hypothetical protein
MRKQALGLQKGFTPRRARDTLAKSMRKRAAAADGLDEPTAAGSNGEAP